MRSENNFSTKNGFCYILESVECPYKAVAL